MGEMWLIQVQDGNGDELHTYGPFPSKQTALEWARARSAAFPSLGYDLVQITPPGLWPDPAECPYEGA